MDRADINPFYQTGSIYDNKKQEYSDCCIKSLYIILFFTLCFSCISILSLYFIYFNLSENLLINFIWMYVLIFAIGIIATNLMLYVMIVRFLLVERLSHRCIVNAELTIYMIICFLLALGLSAVILVSGIQINFEVTNGLLIKDFEFAVYYNIFLAAFILVVFLIKILIRRQIN